MYSLDEKRSISLDRKIEYLSETINNIGDLQLVPEMKFKELHELSMVIRENVTRLQENHRRLRRSLSSSPQSSSHITLQNVANMQTYYFDSNGRIIYP